MSESNVILYSIYGYIASAITSSLMRYDFNVFFSYGIVFLYSIYYNKDKIKFGKLILQILCVVIIADIIWMIFMLPYYGGSQTTKEWKYTSGLRILMIIMAFIEILIKGIIGYYIFNEYKKNSGDVNDLYKLGGYFNDNNNVNDHHNINDNNILINKRSTPLNHEEDLFNYGIEQVKNEKEDFE
jgi:hypothetical protein